MEHLTVDLSKTGIRNPLLRDYLEGHPRLQQFYRWKPEFNSFEEVIQERMKFKVDRIVLMTELENQHLAFYDKYPNLKSQIKAIESEKTFTVTTGHQLCLATGPLYFIYKIVSTINLAKELKQRFPEYHFIPVYWMATEDHDFEEINHLYLFNKKIIWEQHVKGVTGKIPTNTLAPVLAELNELLGDTIAVADIIQLMEDAYLNHNNLSDATRFLVLHLFGDEGLLVIDADRKELKMLFQHVMKEELENQASMKLVTQTNKQLESYYQLQISPRPINLFYLDDGFRERIIKAPDTHFEIINTDLAFSSTFMMDLLHHQPERFSPNVVLRPVYQEAILPNLAYVGGPGEISYWLQLKSVFDHFGIFYPMLVPRNHALIINHKQLQKFTALGFTKEDLFRPVDELISQYVKSLDGISSSLEKEKEKISVILNEIAIQFSTVDSTLQATVQSELQRSLNGMEGLEKKLQAALKRKNETAVNQIKSTIEKVKPANQFQERYSNFIPYYLKYNHDFIKELLDVMKPLSVDLDLFVEEG